MPVVESSWVLGCLFHSKPNVDVLPSVRTNRGTKPAILKLCFPPVQVNVPSLISFCAVSYTSPNTRSVLHDGQTNHRTTASLIEHPARLMRRAHRPPNAMRSQGSIARDRLSARAARRPSVRPDARSESVVPSSGWRHRTRPERPWPLRNLRH